MDDSFVFNNDLAEIKFKYLTDLSSELFVRELETIYPLELRNAFTSVVFKANLI